MGGRGGVGMTHRDQFERWLETNELRCTEKGDAQDRRNREMREWCESGKNHEERGPFPYRQTWSVVDSQYRPR